MVPTIKLLEQVCTRFQEMSSTVHVGIPQLLVSVTQQQTLASVGEDSLYESSGEAARNALAFLNGIEGAVGALVLLTTANFQAFLPRIKRPHEWVVFVDELVEALEFLGYPLGSNPERSESILGELNVESGGDPCLQRSKPTLYIGLLAIQRLIKNLIYYE